VGSTSITATLNGVSGSATVTVTDATITTIAIIVNPSSATIARGFTAQLTATCNYSDGTTGDCTAVVSWTSDNSIPISNAVGMQGLLTGKAGGYRECNHDCAWDSWVTGSATVTVTAATLVSIAVTAASPSVASGFTDQLTATGTFSNGSMVTLKPSDVSWTSSDMTQATVDANGLVTGTGAGSPTITATQSGGTVSGKTTVTVTAAILQTITVIPQNPALPLAPSIAKGTSVQLIAIGNFSDHTAHDITATAHWDSSNAGFATVGNTGSVPGAGLVTGVGVGSVTITATQGAATPGSTTVKVTAATVSRLIVATVFNPPVVPVPPLSVSLSAKPKSVDLIATAVFSDGSVQNVTQQTDWISSDHSVASIISSSSTQTNGRLDPVKVGTTTITGTLVISGTPFQGSLMVTLTN
jgi:uncharacterized protein YjdB